jgi:hypothetical protein
MPREATVERAWDSGTVSFSSTLSESLTSSSSRAVSSSENVERVAVADVEDIDGLLFGRGRG